MINSVIKARNKLIVAALAALVLCISGGAAVAATLAQNDVAEYGLPGLYVPAFPGVGVSTEALVGDYCASVEAGEAGVCTLQCVTATDSEIDARVAAETAPIGQNTAAIAANKSAIDNHAADRSLHGGSSGAGVSLSDQSPQALGVKGGEKGLLRKSPKCQWIYRGPSLRSTVQ